MGEILFQRSCHAEGMIPGVLLCSVFSFLQHHFPLLKIDHIHQAQRQERD